jgi:hypothetical protein
MQREMERLIREYDEAARAGNWAKAREIYGIKSDLTRELRKLGQGKSGFANRDE